MSTQLTVNANVFNYPDAGEPAGWGEDASAWAKEVTDVLATISSVDDILETTFLLTNNQTTVADVTGLQFSVVNVRKATIDYSIYITTSTNEIMESGTIEVGFKNTANDWDITQIANFDISGVVFSITAAGQVQYTSTNVAGTSYSGTLKFTAVTLSQ